jgi:photosystem II stability/assembly factor-like uncharacterized protein
MKKNSTFTNYYMLLLVWFCAIPLLAQEESWEQMNGPYGGNISHMITGKNGSVCAATNDGGLYVSNDKGAHWSEKIPGKIFSLAVDSNGKLYAGGASRLYSSTDDGKSWISLADFIGGISGVAVDSSNRIYIEIGQNINRSDDGGLTWIELDKSGEYLTSLTAGPPGVVFAGFIEGGIYRTLDYGTKWSAMNSGLTLSPDDNIFGFTFTKSGYVLCSSLRGKVFRAKINEEIWTQVLNASATAFNSLAADSSGNIYFGTIAFGTNGNGIYKSADEGITWETVNNGLGSLNVVSIATVADGTIYAGTLGMGVFRSSNMGLSWEETNNGLDNLMVTCLNGNSKGEIFAGSDGGGMQKSSDGGLSWSRLGAERDPTFIPAIKIDSYDRIFMSSSEGGFISENDGKDWRMLLNKGYGFHFAFSNDGQIIASTWYAVLKSDSAAVIWDTILVEKNVYYLVVNDSNYIFALAEEGVQISKDFGATWTSSKVNNGRRYYYRLPFISKSGSLFVTADDSADFKGKLFRSDDNCNSWIELDIGQSNFQRVTSFASDNNGCIYAGTKREGVYRSCDNGNTWIPFNNGLMRMDISSVYIDQKGYLYAGAEGGDNMKKSSVKGSKMSAVLNDFFVIESNMSDVIPGSYLFRIKTGGATAVETSKPGPEDFILEQNFPNPFSTTSTIRFHLAQTENVSLIIYNSLGQIVLSPVNGKKVAGLHEVVINGTDMPAGVYFYQLQTQRGSIERKFIVFK